VHLLDFEGGAGAYGQRVVMPPPASRDARPSDLQIEIQGALTEVYDPDNVKALPDDDVLMAMECLLQLEKNNHKSTLGALARLEVSQIFGPVPINLAALYYVSYLYTQNWNHASAIALRGPGCEEGRWEYVTRQKCVRTAYKAYRQWFAQVKEIGLERARASGLSPLKGAGLLWY
jgi:hypothetical protein